jgi:hypothetical protein
LKLYVYPSLDPKTGTILSAADLRVAPKLQHLFMYLIENQHIQPIRAYNPECLSTFNVSRDVFRRLQEGDPTWIYDVPPNVGLLICQRHLLGYDPQKFESNDEAAPPA